MPVSESLLLKCIYSWWEARLLLFHLGRPVGVGHSIAKDEGTEEERDGALSSQLRCFYWMQETSGSPCKVWRGEAT